ncbi:hypothetical protein EDD16DRAFT_1640948, partial [Pisolithus croceorrhizus]
MALYDVFQHWQEIVPGEDPPVLDSPVELEDLKLHHATWLQHQELLEVLDREFDLGEYGHVMGDRSKFEMVRAALWKKKLEYIEQGKDDETRRKRSLWWPYRDTLRDEVVLER